MNNKIDAMYDLPVPEYARGFFDPEKTRKWLQETALTHFDKALNKIESQDFKLKVKDLKLKDPNKRFSIKEQKQALMDKKDLTLPIEGTVELIDKRSNQVVDKKKTTIAHIPWITDRNGAIYNGNEALITTQQRLTPGIYTRIKETGEAEAHINIQSGTGSSGRVIFYPETATFVYRVGTTEIKLYGILKDLGVADSTMEQYWGKEILLKNKKTYTGQEIEKLYSKLFTF